MSEKNESFVGVLDGGGGYYHSWAELYESPLGVREAIHEDDFYLFVILPVAVEMGEVVLSG